MALSRATWCKDRAYIYKGSNYYENDILQVKIYGIIFYENEILPT